LSEYRDTEPAFITKGEAKVGSAFLLKLLLISVGSDAFHKGEGVIRLKNLGFQTSKSFIYSQYRWSANGKMNVRSTLCDASM
jgi:hypothetical protein